MGSTPVGPGRAGIVGNWVGRREGRPAQRPVAGLPGEPTWPETYSMVEYGGTAASELAIEYRFELAQMREDLGMTEREFSEANIAVVTFVDPTDPQGTPVMIPMISAGGMIGGQRGGPHSEERLLAALQALGIPLAWVTGMYTERQPCGESGHNCAHRLAQALPGVPVTFSVEFDDTPSQQRGLEMLESLWDEQLERRREEDVSGEGEELRDEADLPLDEAAGGTAMLALLHAQLRGDTAAQAVIVGGIREQTLKEIKAGLKQEGVKVTGKQFEQGRATVRTALGS